jgi:hypothetical protein
MIVILGHIVRQIHGAPQGSSARRHKTRKDHFERRRIAPRLGALSKHELRKRSGCLRGGGSLAGFAGEFAQNCLLIVGGLDCLRRCLHEVKYSRFDLGASAWPRSCACFIARPSSLFLPLAPCPSHMNHSASGTWLGQIKNVGVGVRGLTRTCRSL